jgi:DNA-binding FadR family transcriptional regulator
LGPGIDELQRISACMLGSSAPASLAHEAVLGIEMGLLRQGWPTGLSLGALPEVRKQLDLGRPAFRETITILEARGLLDVRRGPGGGLFVGAPALEDVACAVLMHLALVGETRACIEEFRMLVWRMIVSVGVERRMSFPTVRAEAGQWGFAVDLAELIGNPTMGLFARLAEMLVRISLSGHAPSRDRALELAIRRGDLARAFERLEDLAGPAESDPPVISLEVAERSFSLSGRKSAMALAARMTRELSASGGTQEAEWETAERLGYTDAVVRQARRILQDFGIVRCRQGRKGAQFAPEAAPTGVIRLLAPCLVASAMSVANGRETITYLVSTAPALAARRASSADVHVVARPSSGSGSDAVDAVMLENRILELTGNPLLAIAVRSLGIASILSAGDAAPPEDCHEVIALNRRILQAIQVGDEAAAGVLAQIKLEVMQRPAEGYRRVA